MRFSDAEISGEGLQDQAEQARQGLRDLARSVHESEYAERALQTRIADLKRNLQLARDQAQSAQDELDGLPGELFELAASASQAGLQEDRARVVSGTSMSVRVDLGGPRLNKNTHT